METVVLAFSGGLDTSFCTLWLREELGARVVTVCVDTGGFDADGLAAVEARAQELGAAEHHTVDARVTVFERFVAYLVKGDALRGGVYPVSVAAERAAQTEAVVEVARAVGATAIAHGSTGAGNDQVRFDVALAALAPDLAVHAPVRELGLSRAQERDWLAERGIAVPEETVSYSLNEGLFGTTIGGSETHDSWAAPSEQAWTMTRSAAAAVDDPEELVIGFDAGLPVSLDGEPFSGVELLAALNARAEPHGIGRGVHVGDTILGVKGRIAFEAPGPLILIRAHRELSKLVHSKWQAHWCRQLGETWATLLHEGLSYDPVMRDIEAFLDSANALVTGEARVRLYKGSYDVVGTRSPHSLLDAGIAVYGEGALAWTGEEARGFARIHGVPSLLAARRARGGREGAHGTSGAGTGSAVTGASRVPPVPAASRTGGTTAARSGDESGSGSTS